MLSASLIKHFFPSYFHIVPKTCKMWSGIVVLKHPNVQFHVRNDVILQDFVSLYLMPVNAPATCRLQEAFYHHNGFLPTLWHCLHETGRLTARSLEYNVHHDLHRRLHVHQHVTGENETHLRINQSSTWHLSISSTADAPLSDVGSKT